jgi:hypothetical protein
MQAGVLTLPTHTIGEHRRAHDAGVNLQAAGCPRRRSSLRLHDYYDKTPFKFNETIVKAKK